MVVFRVGLLVVGVLVVGFDVVLVVEGLEVVLGVVTVVVGKVVVPVNGRGTRFGGSAYLKMAGKFIN